MFGRFNFLYYLCSVRNKQSLTTKNNGYEKQFNSRERS